MPVAGSEFTLDVDMVIAAIGQAPDSSLAVDELALTETRKRIVVDGPYTLVTTIENMHATKPNQAYYQEILEMIDCQPDQALMVGDDCRNDVEPAAGFGLFTYWIELPGAALPAGLKPTGQGSLEDLALRLSNGWLKGLAFEKSS